MATTLGWLATLASASVAWAKLADPTPRGRFLPDGPIMWMTVVAGGLAPLLLLTSAGLIPRPGGIPLGLVQQGVWIAGLVLVVRLFRRTRSAAYSDSLLINIIPKLLPQITALQRRSADPEPEALIEQARAAIQRGHGREALRCLSRVTEHLQHSPGSAGEEGTALCERLSHLCRMHGLPRPASSP
ncbi:hypothetical protein [Streptomyces sp. NPDC046985]|uniref:hypothetical protein n=1 Tax=Streptomyces sp. NPDC046985 TaxID=3155377 RepID=UPI0033DD1646